MSIKTSRDQKDFCNETIFIFFFQDVETEYQLQIAQKNDFIEATKLMEKDMEIKTTLYTHMKEQIDSIKDENIRLSEKLRVEF